MTQCQSTIVSTLILCLGFVAGCGPDLPVMEDVRDPEARAALEKFVHDSGHGNEPHDQDENLDLPEGPRELFVYRCRFAAENKGLGYEWTEEAISTELVNRQKITGVSRWKIPREPLDNEAVVCEVVIDSSDVSEEETHNLASYAVQGGGDFAREWQGLIDLMAQAKADGPSSRRVDGMFVVATYETGQPSESKTRMRWTFQLDPPKDWAEGKANVTRPSDGEIDRLFSTTWVADHMATMEYPPNQDVEDLADRAWLYCTQYKWEAFFKDAGLRVSGNVVKDPILLPLDYKSETLGDRFRILDENHFAILHNEFWIVFQAVGT